MILTAERIMHSRLYGSGRHITAIRVHALFADHTIKTPNLISERPPRGDLFTLIESTTEPQLCCGALVAIGTKRTCQPPLRLSAIGATADITSAIRRQCYFSSNTNVL